MFSTVSKSGTKMVVLAAFLNSSLKKAQFVALCRDERKAGAMTLVVIEPGLGGEPNADRVSGCSCPALAEDAGRWFEDLTGRTDYKDVYEVASVQL